MNEFRDARRTTELVLFSADDPGAGGIGPEYGWGKFEILSSGHRSVFAHHCEFQKGAVLAAYNLPASPVDASIKLQPGEQLLELFGEHAEEPFGPTRKRRLQDYEFRWFRLRGNAWRDF